MRGVTFFTKFMWSKVSILVLTLIMGQKSEGVILLLVAKLVCILCLDVSQSCRSYDDKLCYKSVSDWH